MSDISGVLWSICARAMHLMWDVMLRAIDLTVCAARDPGESLFMTKSTVAISPMGGHPPRLPPTR